MICAVCGEEFTPDPGKPGLINQCWECGREEEESRMVDPLVASQADRLYEWVPMRRSKYFRTIDVVSRQGKREIRAQARAEYARLVTAS